MTQRPPVDVQATALLTIPEVARELRVARSTVYRLINAGDLPHVTVGTKSRVARTDLARYIEANRSAA